MPRLPIALEIYAEYIILSNESRSRSFICIPIEDRLKSLEAVVTRGVNVAVADMRQPLYHEKPKFHIRLVCACRDVLCQYNCPW